VMKCEKGFEETSDKHFTWLETITEVSTILTFFLSSFCFARSVHLLSSSSCVGLDFDGGTCSKSDLVTSFISDVIHLHNDPDISHGSNT
jgi:hypothetical protein